LKKNKNINLIIDGIREKKGQDIVLINLIEIINSPCSFFVICTAGSKTQINSIAQNIKKNLIEKVSVKIWREEGRDSNWRLLDYGDIIIHIFKQELRLFYQIEELWGDGKIKKYK
tara:strand:+ start:111 stop:455 length:345 start_codon:yes stop_codon:yes gene_type:complete